MKSDQEKLLELGFETAGHWELQDGRLAYKLHKHSEARSVLYAFLCSGRAMYIGKTRLSLRQRMSGYKHPATSQRTNVRNNSYIHEQLESKQAVEILTFPPKELNSYKGYSINLAAGLEDSLIETFKPKWNLNGKIQEA